MIYLVSHGHCADRAAGSLADHLRPLSPRGWRQSVALAERMSGADISAVVASPTHRGVQTVSGLALRRGLPVGTDPRLGRDATAAGVLELMGEQPPAAVLCTHSAVVALALAELRRRGAALASPLPGVWELGGSAGPPCRAYRAVSVVDQSAAPDWSHSRTVMSSLTGSMST